MYGVDPSLYLVAVGNTRPHDVYVYQMTGDDIKRAEDQRQRYLDQLRQCQESGHWPDPSQQLHPLGIHSWGFDEPEVELSAGDEPIDFGDEEEY